jgi:hypothetical protein
LILSLTFATFSFVSASTARPPTQQAPVPADAFRPVVLPSPAAASQDPSPGGDDRLPSALPTPPAPPPISDFRTSARVVEPRSNPELPAQAAVEVKATPRPTPTPARTSGGAARAPAPAASRTGHAASGQASWYCKTGVSACAHGYPGGMYAAAGPALRVGAWRGRTVSVCGSGNCISVRLIDWCACGGGRTGRIIDLYGDAFQRLAPLNAGVQQVRVSW